MVLALAGDFDDDELHGCVSRPLTCTREGGERPRRVKRALAGGAGNGIGAPCAAPPLLAQAFALSTRRPQCGGGADHQSARRRKASRSAGRPRRDEVARRHGAAGSVAARGSMRGPPWPAGGRRHRHDQSARQRRCGEPRLAGTAAERLAAEASKQPARRAASALIEKMKLTETGDPRSLPAAEPLTEAPDVRLFRGSSSAASATICGAWRSRPMARRSSMTRRPACARHDPHLGRCDHPLADRGSGGARAQPPAGRGERDGAARAKRCRSCAIGRASNIAPISISSAPRNQRVMTAPGLAQRRLSGRRDPVRQRPCLERATELVKMPSGRRASLLCRYADRRAACRGRSAGSKHEGAMPVCSGS